MEHLDTLRDDPTYLDLHNNEIKKIVDLGLFRTSGEEFLFPFNSESEYSSVNPLVFSNGRVLLSTESKYVLNGEQIKLLDCNDTLLLPRNITVFKIPRIQIFGRAALNTKPLQSEMVSEGNKITQE